MSRSAWPNIPPRTKEDKEEFLDITRRKFQKMAKEASPLECWYSVTERCNLHCKVCFSNSGKPWEDELTTTEAHRLLDNIAQAGTRTIVFGGGEPTLREDLLDLACYAAQWKQMAVAVNTNGLLLDRKYVAALAQAGVMQVRISVDGLQQSHEWNRGRGTFERAIQAIKNCVAEGIPSVVMASIICQLNHKEVPELVKLALGLGASSVIMPLIPEGRGKPFEYLTLTKEQTRDWQRYLFKQQKAYGVNKIQFQQFCMISEDRFALEVAANPDRIGTHVDTPIGHADGMYQYAISANGKVYLVGTFTPELFLCDLREQRLSEVWHNSELINLLQDRDKLEGKCGRCEYRFVCGGSRRRAFLYTADVMAEDPKCWYEPTEEAE